MGALDRLMGDRSAACSARAESPRAAGYPLGAATRPGAALSPRPPVRWLGAPSVDERWRRQVQAARGTVVVGSVGKVRSARAQHRHHELLQKQSVELSARSTGHDGQAAGGMGLGSKDQALVKLPALFKSTAGVAAASKYPQANAMLMGIIGMLCGTSQEARSYTEAVESALRLAEVHTRCMPQYVQRRLLWLWGDKTIGAGWSGCGLNPWCVGRRSFTRPSTGTTRPSRSALHSAAPHSPDIDHNRRY